MTIEEIRAAMCDHYCQLPYQNLGERAERFCAACPLNELPHWIPCSEKLPSDHKWYLTTVLIHPKGSPAERVIEINKYLPTLSKWNTDFPDDVVLAWMPIPEPYKGG